MRRFVLLSIAVLFLTAAAGCREIPTGRMQGNVSHQLPTYGVSSNANHAKVSMTGDELPTRYDFTDASGNYSIKNIEPGTYTVIADYGEATNMPDSNASWFYGETVIDGASNYSMAGGTYPDVSITTENVTIVDDATATVNFILTGF